MWKLKEAGLSFQLYYKPKIVLENVSKKKTFLQRNLQVQMALLVNSTKYVRAQLYQFYTNSSKRGKNSHSVRPVNYLISKQDKDITRKKKHYRPKLLSHKQMQRSLTKF